MWSAGLSDPRTDVSKLNPRRDVSWALMNKMINDDQMSLEETNAAYI